MLRIAALVLALIVLPAFAEEPPTSPRLRRLAADVTGVQEFWHERVVQGAPMIEPLPDDPQTVLVTFLWRGDVATKSVFVIAFDQIQFSNASYLARGKMMRLPGTDVWYRTYRTRCDLRFSYRFKVDDTAELHPDPLNPVHYQSRSGDSSVAELPCAAPQPEVVRREGIPRGEVTKETFKGSSGETHPLQIYTPAQPGDAPMSLLVIVGGEFSEPFPVPTMLDNLIAEERLPPTLAVSIGFADMAEYVKASRSDERFAHYVAEELVPWLRTRYRIAEDPRQSVIAGASAPGAAALFIAMRHPKVFANVLTQAGGYSVSKKTAADELIASGDTEAEPLARELAHRPALPLKVFLAVGVMDDVLWQGNDPFYAQSTVLVAARHLRDVLEAKGYSVTYREFGGGHEALAWRGTFVDGLAWLLGTHP